MSGNYHNNKTSGNLISLSTNKNCNPSGQYQQQQQPKQLSVNIQQHSSHLQNSSNSTQQQEAQPQQASPPNSLHNNNILIQHNSHNSNPSNNHQSLVTNGNSNNNNQIPPRYQPPPQPIGPTKHISGLGNTNINGKLLYAPELSVPHLNIKYPPEIPKLSSVYIPDSIKNSSSRFSQRYRLGGSGNINIGSHHLIGQNNEESLFLRQQQQEMLKFVRKTDGDSSVVVNGQLGQNTGRLTAEQSRHLQSLLNELRILKDANQRLSDDNQELRDLCCFLDDDRQKGRKLAREWQRFGRYTASVMRQEVSAYQSKLRQLDDKQQELIRDNLELKELCLYLDEERAHVATNALCVNCGGSTRPTLRDDGDGSSSSTNADDTMSAIRNYERQIPELTLRSALSDQTLQYVRSLERRIRELEEESDNSNNNNIQQQISDPISGRPEAVVRALQVLEVREQLERDRLGSNGNSPNLNGNPNIEHMDDGEKALVREMCNVVWRKLEESPNTP